MTNKEYYQETFSQLHGQVRPEMLQTRRPRHKRLKCGLLAAAVLCLLTAGAVAKDWFGLRALLLPRQETVERVDEKTGETRRDTVELIGLQGYAGAPESQALAEWEAFRTGYDTDGVLLAQVGNGPTGLDSRYALYSVYTQEMAETLEEIAERYGLTLYRELNVIDHAELTDRVGGEFLSECHGRNWGYIYDNGTFQTDGDALVEGFGKVDYQLRRAVKGTFDEVLLNIDRWEDYREWQYQTACGETVLLALGPAKGLILGDFPDCFVTVNVLAGSDPENGMWPGGLTAEALEALADGIDFTVLKQVKIPEMRGDSLLEEPAEEPEKAGFYENTGITEEAASCFAGELKALLESGNRLSVMELFCYPCEVTVESGVYTVFSPEELAPYYDEAVEQEVRTLSAVLEPDSLFPSEGLVGAGSGEIWFGLVDGSIRLLTLQSPNGAAIRPAA